MIRIGIIGDIGSGKSYVAKQFGFPVFNADIESDKLFYDVIYNPNKTNFLLKAEELGNKIENGKMMFIYQAQLAFKIWHNILPNVTDNLLD